MLLRKRRYSPGNFAVTSACNSPAGDFWAITSYFNPVRYRRRLSNFKIFRKHLTVPLVAVELAYSDDFELQEQDADILVQLRGGAVLWHKERLLNVALKALPRSCRKAAWLDCDIVFRSQDWAQCASALLERVAIGCLHGGVGNPGRIVRCSFP